MASWTVDPDEPYVKPERWNEELMSVGFKAMDTVIFDSDEPFQTNAIMIVSPDMTYKPTKKIALLCRSQDSDPHMLIQRLRARDFAVSRYNLGDRLPVGQDVIALLDEAGPFFQSLDDITLTQFKDVIGFLGDSKIMWITRLCHMNCQDPRYAQAIGVARTIRSEMLLNFTTCETSNIDADSDLITDVITKFQLQVNEGSLGPDFEFVIMNSTIQVGRFYPFSLTNELLVSEVGKEFMLKMTRTGRLGTLQWSPKCVSPCSGDEVDVVTHAVGVNFVVR